MIGSEVVRVSLEHNGFYIHFQDSTVMIYKVFTASGIDHRKYKINKDLEYGNIAALWSIVGKTVKRITLEEFAEFEFSNGVLIQLEPGHSRGEILSAPSTIEDGMGWDTF